jgi:pantoate--beta-alanine ligase
MKVILNNIQLKKIIKLNQNIGFVPTMGSLHKGHISLIKESKKKSKKTLVSIFVNPKQFNDKKDFINYPRNINKDKSILRNLKVDFLYLPSAKEIFPKSSKFIKKISKKDKILCAKFRKGHFEGVLNVMDRLTYLINPTNIYMGEKDYQQFYIVKKYLEKKYKTNVILCKTIRDKRGFALSSRNKLLKKSEIIKAQKITKNLIKIKSNIKKNLNVKNELENRKKELEEKFSIKIQYLELRNKNSLNLSIKKQNSKLFVAYYLNHVRLIDNF